MFYACRTSGQAGAAASALNAPSNKVMGNVAYRQDAMDKK